MAVAHEYFRKIGFDKTRVGSIAEGVGVSAAYVYKFFESKQAIGNAVCCLWFEQITADIRRRSGLATSEAGRLRVIFSTHSAQAGSLTMYQPKLREIVGLAWQEQWSAVTEHGSILFEIIGQAGARVPGVTQLRKLLLVTS